MKRCPTCDKEFPDSMRFCQTDGTVLMDDAPPVDPYKTVVGNQADIAAAIPPVDPFKTMVAMPPPKQEEDILQLPPEQPASIKSESKSEDVPKLDLPPAPVFGGVPIIEPKTDAPSEIPPAAPPMPNFGDSGKESNEPKPPETSASDATAVMNSSPFADSASPSPFDSKPFVNDFSGKSPYGNLDNKPIPSPFDDSLPPSYQPPAASPFDEPPTIRQAEPVFNQPDAPNNAPFGQPPPFAAAEPVNPPFQQNEWTPPPAPVAGWQDQGLGANTPFQPPPANVGQDQTLAVVSLVCGILSILCCGLFTGIPAIITGYMAKNNVDANPNQYTGRGMAIAGMILGGVGTVLFIVGIILQVMLGAFGRF